MPRGVMRTVRYAWSWSGRGGATTREMEIDRAGTRLPATLYLPNSRRQRLPGWVIMGGVTRMGRHHPQLSRFAHALSSAGAAVLVPEVPEWRRLHPTPRVTKPTVRGALDALDQLAEVRSGRRGVVGLSFGAPQVARAAAGLSDRIGSVVLFGGYFDLERALHYQLTGEHDWAGERYRACPDPFGRWVMGGSYLTRVPGYEDADEVAVALRRLAAASSDLRCPAWLPEHDALKTELRLCLPDRWRSLFDRFAPPAGAAEMDSDEGGEWATCLADACRRVDPALDPGRGMPELEVPVRLMHGRGDRLVPFTESLRFRRELSAEADATVTITGLLAHSGDERPPTLAARVREFATLFAAMRQVVTAV